MKTGKTAHSGNCSICCFTQQCWTNHDLTQTLTSLNTLRAVMHKSFKRI